MRTISDSPQGEPGHSESTPGWDCYFDDADGAFSEAAELVTQGPTLSVGCHAVLIDGKPALDSAKVSSLLNFGPHFRHSLINFACVAMAGRISEAEVEAEVMAQIQKLQSAGIPVSHLDSHKHTHMFPCVPRGMMRAAKRCGVMKDVLRSQNMQLISYRELPLG